MITPRCAVDALCRFALGAHRLLAAREAEEPMVVVPAPQTMPEAADRGHPGEDGGGEEQVCEYE